MPGPADTFQQIAAPQQGPFSDFLRPVQPRAIDQPEAPNTGWESGPVGAGKVALGFLQGIRQNRVADFLEQEREAQAQQDVYQQHVNSVLADPGLTDQGREAIRNQANQVMAYHAQHQMQDVKGSGPAKFFKELLIHATGGPMKTREPIDFQKETGAIQQTLAQNPTYKTDYWRQAANVKLAAALAPLGDTASGEQVGRIAAQIAREMDLQGKLGPEANSWVQNAGFGFVGANTPAGMIQAAGQMLPKRPGTGMPVATPGPATAPPPQMNFNPLIGSTPTAPPPAAAAPVAQAAPTQAPATGPKAGDYVTINGQRVQIKSVSPNGQFEY